MSRHGGLWRTRWQRWWWQRLPASDTLDLTHRNVYILPSRPGLMLALTLLLLLLGSINYQLNLGYLLTFLMVGTSVASMVVAHRNLRGLALSLRVAEPVHAGQAVGVSVELRNPDRWQRYGIGLCWPGGQGEAVWVDVAAASTQHVWLQWPALARGWHTLPPLQLQSRFPLGTFTVWSWWRPACRVLVYPSIEAPAPPLPDGGHGLDRKASAEAPGVEREAWAGVRPYRRSDPLNRLLWKRVARQPEDDPASWWSREAPPSPGTPCWLDSHGCGLSDPEAQRQRLCAWVLAAESRGSPYGLRLPGCSIAPALGPAHRQRCLEALACH